MSQKIKYEGEWEQLTLGVRQNTRRLKKLGM